MSVINGTLSDNVHGLSANNFMIVNVDKTKEIVLHRPPARSPLPQALATGGIEQNGLS